MGAVGSTALAALAGLVLGLVLALVAVPLGVAGLAALVVGCGVVVLAARSSAAVLTLFAATLPLGPLTLGAGLEVVQAVSLLAVLVVLGRAVLARRVDLPPAHVGVPLVALLVVSAIATAGASDPGTALRLDAQLVLLVGLVLAVRVATTSPRAVARLALVTVVAGAVTAAWALVSAEQVTAYYGGAVVTGRTRGLFSQPNELGLFCAVLLVVAAGLVAAADRPGRRVLPGAAGLVLLLGLAGSLSRGGWIGAATGLAVLAVLAPAARRPLAWSVAGVATVSTVAAAVGSAFSGAFVARLSSLVGGSTNPYDERPLIWAEAWRQASERPVVGHGPGAFPVESADLAQTGVVVDAVHAHGLFLNVAVEFGLVGVLTLLGLMAGLALTARRAATTWRQRGTGPLAVVPTALAAALVAVAVHGLIDYPLRNPTVATTVWLVIGLLVACDRSHAPVREQRPAGVLT